MLLGKNYLIKLISLIVNLVLVICVRDVVSKNPNVWQAIGMGKYIPPEEKNPNFWYSLAKQEVAKRVATRPIYRRATNIIYFLGDGMSLSTLTAARIRKGQLRGATGEESSLFFESFPWVGLSKTYCTNSQVADSACSATAYLCGVKANILTIGVSANVEFNNCTKSMDPNNQVSSLLAWAQKARKSTGFITTTTLTHASPAGTYAHVASRFWESDTDVANKKQDPLTCMDIAQQLIKKTPGSNFDVMMGGGMGKFLPNTTDDAHGSKGQRSDGQNLLKLWKQKNPKGAIVTDRTQLLNLNLRNTDKIMGVFNSKLMDYNLYADHQKQPSLAEMTEVAIKFLKQKKRNGFVLFIEGGRIDHGHHATQPGISIDETLEFDKAVEVAHNLTNSLNTLIIVTADHAHPMTISGYPSRGTPILSVNQHDVDRNGRKYATINYAVGPEQYLDTEGKSLDLEKIFLKPDAIHPSQVPGLVGVHSGDDVGIFANGPFAHLFSGVLQQHTIPHLMAHAAGIRYQ